MANHEQPEVKKPSLTERMLKLGAGLLGLTLGADFIRSLFRQE